MNTKYLFQLADCPPCSISDPLRENDIMLNGHKIWHKSIQIDSNDFVLLIPKKVIYIFRSPCDNTHIFLIYRRLDDT